MSKGNKKPWYRNPAYLGVIVAIVAIVVSIILWQFGPNPPRGPDFSISVSPMEGLAPQGGVIQTTITVKGAYGYVHPVSLSASGHPSDAVITFIPPLGDATPGYASTMTINVGSKVPLGDFMVTIKGSGADGKEHICNYVLTIKPTTVTPPSPVEAYMVYSDAGIAAGDVWVWSGADWELEPPRLVDGSYVTADAPEGTTCFAIMSGSGSGNYVGWGVFLGIFENHELITPHTGNLSDYKNLEFWVKTPIDLKIEIQQDNPKGKKSSSCLISNYGWNSDLPDIWQKISIPKSAFRNVDLTKIFCPFMITGKGGEVSFYVDEVIWVP
ncbi:MAG: hypothetical protein MUO97_00995 [Dehalococcoidia bacterium]|nr:hypothetical protein [Dehalococcoidia bacterium]